MKIWTSEHTFEHSWDTVVQAAWRKYPNPHNPSVVGIDVVDRHVDNKGILRSHRLLSTKWGFPNWAVKILGLVDDCYVSEVSAVRTDTKAMRIDSRNILGQDSTGFGSEYSEVDPRKKIMKLKARNITFCNVITIDEQLVYRPHPQDKNKTQLKQEAVVTVKGIPLSSYMENFVANTISDNAGKGRQAMEWVIGKIKQEAVGFKEEASHTIDSVFHTSTI